MLAREARSSSIMVSLKSAAGKIFSATAFRLDFVLEASMKWSDLYLARVMARQPPRDSGDVPVIMTAHEVGDLRPLTCAGVWDIDLTVH